MNVLRRDAHHRVQDRASHPDHSNEASSSHTRIVKASYTQRSVEVST